MTDGHSGDSGPAAITPERLELIWGPFSRAIGDSWPVAAVLAIVLLEGGVCLLATLEGILLPSSTAVTRGFLDYWSWHVGFVLVVPAAIWAGIGVAVGGPRALSEIQAALARNNEAAAASIRRRWARDVVRRRSWSAPLVHAVASLGVVVGEEAAWRWDRGTAFSDLLVNGKLSLTGAYTALALFVGCFLVLQVVFRSLQVMRFVDSTFRDSNAGCLGSGAHYIPWDPDGLCGLGTVGDLLLRVYSLMLALGLHVAANFLENLLKFCETPAEAVAAAPVSVVLFALIFLLIVRCMVFAPLSSTRVSLSRFRTGRLRDIAHHMARAEGNVLGQETAGTEEGRNGPGLGELERLRQAYLAMPVRPVNVFTMLYLRVSQAASVLAMVAGIVAAAAKIAPR
jgi:hypothetical protein